MSHRFLEESRLNGATLVRMKRSTVLILLAAFMLATVGGWMLSNKGNGNGLGLANYSPLPPGGDFTLQSKEGPVQLSDYAGQIVLIYFGYTYCPDVCPTSLSLIAASLNTMTESEQGQIQSLFISVDPGRDTLDRLEEYAAFFHPGIRGVTGEKAQIDDIAKRYGAYYRVEQGDSAAGYLVDHSSQTVVVGKDGKIKALIPHGTLPDPAVKTIRAYL